MIKWFKKVLAMLIRYHLAGKGYQFIEPSLVKVTPSLVYKGKIAPAGKVFYIASLKYRGVYFHKDVAIERKDISPADEKKLIRLCQVKFVRGIEKRINKA